MIRLLVRSFVATDDNAEITLAIYSIVGKIKTLIKKLSAVKFKHCSNQGATLFNADTPMSSHTSYHWYHMCCARHCQTSCTHTVYNVQFTCMSTQLSRGHYFFLRILRGSGPTLFRKKKTNPFGGKKNP